ncbi:MAG: DUF3999 domain-containing protein [Lysobacteraceae bacterium]|nr:MAG: DUF3999 domain-containing protein [Xanthomonadaceae bacterium]
MRHAGCALVAVFAGAVHAATPGDYAWLFPLATPVADASAWRIDLPPEVYARAHDVELRDLEVFNAAGQPVPFARVSSRAEAASRTRDIALPTLALPAQSRAQDADLRLVIERAADGRVRRIDADEDTGTDDATPTRQWLLDAGEPACAIERITLAWDAPASGVVASFVVEAGPDLQAWRRVGAGNVLALEQDGTRIERRDITIDATREPWLRLQRRDDGVPLPGLRASARCVDRDGAVVPRDWIEANPSGRDEAGAYAYRLPAALPVVGARIELGNDNALAALTLSARDALDATRWTPLARQTAFRLRAGAETLRNADLEFPVGPRRDAFRIESATPLAVAPKLSLAWTPDRFVFLAEGAGPYVLAVGSARARRPAHPVDAALATLRATLGADWQPPAAIAGPPRESAGARALQPAPRPVPWRSWLLWSVLVAGAALIAFFALRLLRDADAGSASGKDGSTKHAKKAGD